MRKELVILTLFLLMTPLMLAQEANETTSPLGNIDIKQFAKDNPWNQTTTISPAWQTLIGGFFGLNLHNESTEISVTEALVFFMIFIMFSVVIADILKMTPLFEKKIAGISGKFIASIVITILVSITGAFINLKNVFISGIAFTIAKINWTWMNNAIAHKTWKVYIVGGIIFVLIIIIHEALGWIEPLIKKYSQVSRAEATGRRFKNTMESADIN